MEEKKDKKRIIIIIIIIIIILLFFLLMVSGTIPSIISNLGGKDVISPQNNADYKVGFDKSIKVKTSGSISSAKIISSTSASVNAKMDSSNNEGEAIFSIKNSSPELSSNVDCEVNGLDQNEKYYYKVNEELDNSYLLPGESTNLIVNIKLLEETNNTLDFTINCKAKPVESSNKKTS